MAVELTKETPEQTRARYPDHEGYIERDGVRVFYEVYGSGNPTVLLLPTWSLMHSRHWKMQIPYLARHCRVVTFDGRGNGRSDRPREAAAYDEREFAADALAVLDATETERAVIVGFSLGGQRGLLLAAEQRERIEAAVFIGPRFLGGGELLPERTVYDFDTEYDTDEGWAKHNRFYWLRDYPDWVEFFIEDLHGAALDEADRGWRGLGARDRRRNPDRYAGRAGLDAGGVAGALSARSLSRARDPRRERCGQLSHARCGLREQTGGRLVVLEGSGHAPHIRDPVKVNLLIREFLDSLP